MITIASLVVAVLAGAAKASHRPVYDLSTLPVFFHSANQSGPFNDAAIKEIAQFSLATVEKFQGTCWQDPPAGTCNQTDIILQQLRRIKAANANITAIAYFNSVIDFPQYRLHTLLEDNPRYRLHTSSGKTVTVNGDHIKDAWVYNLVDSGMFDAFASQCASVVTEEGMDGCFIDRAVNGWPGLPNASHAAEYSDAHARLLQVMQQRVGSGVVVANHGYNVSRSDVSADMVEECLSSATGFDRLNTSIASGKIVECHVGLADDRCGCAPGCESRDNTLAMFLTLMPSSSDTARAYFGCGPWLDDGPDLSANGWQKDYGFALGEPQGPAVLGHDGLWHRSFASGTTVQYSTKTYSGHVQWASTKAVKGL